MYRQTAGSPFGQPAGDVLFWNRNGSRVRTRLQKGPR